MTTEQTCQHKWKIMKTIERTHENFIKQKSPETVYHLRCEKCGDICSRRCFGNGKEGQNIESIPKITLL